MKGTSSAAWAAWLLTAVYYFYQYLIRSAPSVMVPQLADAYGLTAVAVASLAGIFFYGYAGMSLFAGIALDRVGARAVIPAGALAAGVGALLFGLGNVPAANIGRILQGAGGVFALVGA